MIEKYYGHLVQSTARKPSREGATALACRDIAALFRSLIFERQIPELGASREGR